ncbi:PAS-domain containing protein [Erythrobacter alti]|uniref:PAS-domain containing protein n=1 Tax=Erythrobacter alti TaxID=1896145 RepID=UPI0030F499DD
MRESGWIYGLSLAVFCTSWTFFGGVGTAATDGLQFLPIYLGPILVFTLGYGLVRRVLAQAQAQHSTSIADFLSARYGKSAGVAALVTVIATVGSLPYMALQLQSVGSSLVALDPSLEQSVAMDEVVLAVAVSMALFAILFGSRRADRAGDNAGLVLTIAIEAVVKLVALVALAVAALFVLADGPSIPASTVFNFGQVDLRFGILTLLAACAALCLPRQFHMAFVEAPGEDTTPSMRWVFPAYLALTSLVIVPIVLAGISALPPEVPRDSIVMALPLSMGNEALAVLIFIGGLAASTGMIVVASVALSTMISNDLLAPVLFRRALSGEGDRTRLAATLLILRRIVIGALLFLAYLFYASFGASTTLAGLGTLAFAAAAQFAPGLVLGMVSRHGNRIGMLAGLTMGFGLWLGLLIFPAATGTAPVWLVHPDPLVSGVLLSLGANVVIYWFGSALFRPSLVDAAQAAVFVGSTVPGQLPAYATRKRIADIRLLLAQVVGPDRAKDALAGLPRPYQDSDPADETVLAMAERTIAGVVGSSSSRLLVSSWSGGEPVPLADVVAMFDETSRRLTFSADLLQIAIENIDQGVAVVDADMNLVAWNSRYTQMFDLPEELASIGTPIAKLIGYNLRRGNTSEDEIEEQIERRLEHMRAGRRHRLEREQADGVIMRIIGNPAPGGGYVTSYIDITADRRAEQALENKVTERTRQLSDANAALEKATRSKTRFLAAASHDLIQPLNAARLFASALGEEIGEHDPARKLVRDLDGSITSADRLIRALLDISKLDGGGIEPKLETVSLDDVLEDVCREFALQAQAKGIALRRVRTSAWVETDRALLASVLRNLLSNAIRYTDSGGALLGVRRAGDSIRLCVYDTGRGIAPEDVARIFDEFQRVGTADREGLGLGLAIVRRITGLLEIEVETTSTAGQGSCFALHMPVASWRIAQKRQRVPRSTAQLSNARVLVVDNEYAARAASRALLERWELDVTDARGEEDARNATEVAPDLVLMDYRLDDDARGDAVYEALCKYWQTRPPVILYTAEASDETAAAAAAIGAYRLLKPGAPAALRSIIASAISGHRDPDSQPGPALASN